MNNITSVEIKGLSHSICGDARKTEIGELLINGAADIGVLTGLINDLAHQQAVQELDCNGCSLDLPEIGSEMDGDIVGAHVIQDGVVYVLLVAPPGAERELAWADGNEDVHTSISDGHTNTYLLSQLHKVGDSHPAAEHCAKYKELGEYYLPSQLELAQIIANKDAVSRAGLKGWYWTSTQISTSAARNMNASSGSWGYFHKTYEIAVRPIRRIKLAV